jgi:hypothetical protein
MRRQGVPTRSKIEFGGLVDDDTVKQMMTPEKD